MLGWGWAVGWWVPPPPHAMPPASTPLPPLPPPSAQGLRECRPALVRGYESMVMARLLLQRPGCGADILGGWDALLAATLEVGWGGVGGG